MFRKILGCCPNQGGGTSQSQLIVKVYQNIICLSTVHKFDETHTTYIGRGGNNISSLNKRGHLTPKEFESFFSTIARGGPKVLIQ